MFSFTSVLISYIPELLEYGGCLLEDKICSEVITQLLLKVADSPSCRQVHQKQQLKTQYHFS